MGYTAPVDDILFALRTMAATDAEQVSDVYEGLDEGTMRAILEEAGRFASEVLDPLNIPGDRQGSKLLDGRVVTPEGWADAYRRFCEAGWSGLPCPEEFGGQELPDTIAMAACEIWNGANLSFGICPVLTQGAIDALIIGASKELKERYLPKLVSGAWTGTMNLTEPQAGSDLGAVKTRAVRQDDGTYRIFGTKIYISYGEHDLGSNIIHLVLARLPDEPEGTRGISLFLVPKYILDKKGEPGPRNDVVCAGLEHKLGIHASPTCVMNYGENDGAVGFLVGEENRGLHTMFIMMNAARLAVGMQGVALAERATQAAVAYARERHQGYAVHEPHGTSVSIITHPDVRRMLLRMQAMTQAARAICLATAKETDVSRRASDAGRRRAAAGLVALLTPVAKAFATDAGCEVSSLGVQVHGGMGFVEETGAAQFFRDARILPIYEGTNGIQAMDLTMRKVPLEGGAVLAAYLEDLSRTVAELEVRNDPPFGAMGERLSGAVADLRAASVWIGENLQSHPEAVLSVATPYLRLFGITAGGIYLAKGARAAAGDGGGSGDAVPRPVALARYFAEHIAVETSSLASVVKGGAASVLALPPERIGA